MATTVRSILVRTLGAVFLAMALPAAAAPTVLTVTNTNVSGPGSLASALASLDPDVVACPADGVQIAFNIPAATDPGCNAGTGICRIAMPDQAFIHCSSMTIDGYTQPGASPNTATDYTNNAQLRIELDNAGPNPATLRTRGTYNLFGYNGVQDVTVRGLALPRHTLELVTGNGGSVVHGGSGRVVSGNWFGWHADGTAATGAVSKGVFLFGAYLSEVVIGGATPAERNLFTHRPGAICCEALSRGIHGDGVQNAVIEGNFFNVSPAGQPVATNGIVGAIGLGGGLGNGTPYSRDVTIRNNVIYNVASGHPMGLGMGVAMTISRNVVTGHQPGFVAWNWFTVPAGGLRNEDKPVITGFTQLPGEMRVFGTVGNAANATMRLEFFHNTQGGFQGGTQAERFVGEMDIVLDGSGNGSFVASLPPDTRNVSVSSTNLATGETGYLSGSDNVAQVFRLDLARGGVGLGTISVGNPSTLDCTGTCTKLLATNSVVTLTAAAQPGSQFVGWSGACTGVAPCTLTMSQDHSVTASYIGGSGPPVIGNAPLSADVASGVPFSFTYDVTGLAPFAWALEPDCTLPGALSLSPAGAISGTPGNNSERIECAVRVTNGVAPDATQAYELRANVTAGTPLFTASTLPSGTTGVAYNQPVPVQGTPPITINVVAGTTPPGLTLSGTSFLGTPTADGTYNFMLTASGPDGTATKRFTMTIGLGVAPLVTSGAPPSGSEFTAYTHAFAASGTSPIAWSVVSGTLPPGLALDAATGVLSGTPTLNGSFNFTVQAVNGTPPAATQVVAMTIAANSRTLTINRNGSGTGKVVSTPAGIDCGSTCSAHFAIGSGVSVLATPDADSTFASWTNCPSANGPSCAVAMSAGRTVTATFAKKKIALTTNVVGGGQVMSSPSGIACHSGCSTESRDFDLGSVVTLTATPIGPMRFAGWTGACSGASTTCTVTMDAAKSVTATFVQQFLLSVASFGSPATGKVTGTPAGIDCPGVCGVFYDPGAVVQLVATPDPGATFVGWGNACSGTGTCTVTLNGHVSVTATFAPAPTQPTTALLSITVRSPTAAPAGFRSNPAGLACTFNSQGANCSGQFPVGSLVQILPVPARIQYYPLGTCDGSASLPCTVRMDGNRTFEVDVGTATRTVRVMKRDGQGSVSIASSLATTECPANLAECSVLLLKEDNVVIAATPSAGFAFLGWQPTRLPAGAYALPGCFRGTPTCEFGLSDLAVSNSSDPDVTVVLAHFPKIPASAAGVATATAPATARSTRVGLTFNPAPIVVVRDAAGQPVSGARVTFTPIPAAGGASAAKPNPVVVFTSADGMASTPVTANATVGTWALRASIEPGSVAPVNIAMSNTNDVVPIRLPGNGRATIPSSGTVGVMISVQVKTANGTPIPGARVTFTAPTSPNAQGVAVPSGTLAPATVNTNSQGIARTRLVSNGVAGTFTVTVRATPPAGVPLQGASAGFEGDDYVTELTVETDATLADAAVADPMGDYDADGIPNAVEDAEGTLAYNKDNDVFADARLFAMQQYRDFLGREGDAAGVTHWGGQLESGAQSRAQMAETFFNSAEFQGLAAPVARLYFAYFLRIPDYGGLLFWISQFRGGSSLEAISNAFAGSPEFAARYGSLSNAQFVSLVYQNVLGRAPDAGGLAHWTGQIDGGMTRGQMMVAFSESAEYRALITGEVYVTMMYVGMLRREPDAGGFSHWVSYLDAGNSGLALTQGFLDAAEYRARFLP